MDDDAPAGLADGSSSAVGNPNGVIGRSASYPNLQVMGPTGLASVEAMAHHGENQLENEFRTQKRACFKKP